MMRTTMLLLFVGLAACSSTSPRPPESVLSEDVPEWVFNPAFDWDQDDEPLVYYAVGRSRIIRDVNLAEENALADARADVQAFLETTIERLNEAWVAESGDLMNDASLSSAINNEMFTRQVISGTVHGVRIMTRYWDDEDYWVWVRYDAADAFLGTYENELSETLRKQTRELTYADRERMRKELERVVAERNKSD
jgi:hypothetical protein